MGPQPVLFVHHANDMYGADIGLLHTIRSLDRASYYPIVILPADMPTGKLSDELSLMGVEFHFAPLGVLRRKYFTRRHIFGLLKDIVRGIHYVRVTARNRRVALVYVNTIVPVSGAIGARLAGVPVLWHVREILAVGPAFRWTLLRLLGACSTKVVCISKAVRDDLVNRAPFLAKKAIIVYNAVTPKGSRDVENGIRSQLHLPPETCLVGMVGRISHWKGQEVLARAAALVLQKFPGTHFLAVGSYFADEAHYLNDLLAIIDGLGIRGHFHILEYRTNVVEIYRALDVFVLPSTKPEPFGRVTVEAMMEARPVIATNHGGSPELIQEGVTGMLVPPTDPEALAAAIRTLLADPSLRYRLGQAAAAHAKEHFGLERYANELLSVIQQIAIPAKTNVI